MHVLHVVGARPNLMKAAPVLRALSEHSKVKQTLVHTGQHYDANMSEVFFQQLGIPVPDVNLEVSSGSHAQQTAEVMSRLEPVVLSCAPDVVLVYSDVNSTLAAALVCSKLLIPVGHVEAGLRSFDRTMPEEINRLVTDRIADLLFTHSEDADRNLGREGISRTKIYRVGNVMIDSLVRLLPKALQCKMNGLPDRYALVTLHRPSNVDDGRVLKSILDSLLEVSLHLGVVFPVHPRTRLRIEEFGIDAAKAPPFGADALCRISRAATPCCRGHHRLRRHSGRNHLPKSAVSHFAREYGTPGYSYSGHKHPRRPGPGEAPYRVSQDSRGKGKTGPDSASVGWACQRAHRGDYPEALSLLLGPEYEVGIDVVCGLKTLTCSGE